MLKFFSFLFGSKENNPSSLRSWRQKLCQLVAMLVAFVAFGAGLASVAGYNIRDIVRKYSPTEPAPDIEEYNNFIINEISKVFKNCEVDKEKKVDFGPITAPLVLYGTKAIPNIFNFMAESVITDMDFNNPLFLYNFRKQLINRSGFDCLVNSILKICNNDGSKEYIKYFQELLLEKLPAGQDVKQAIILSYLLWNFEDRELLELQKKILIDNYRHGLDPVKKVLLRSYLYRNNEYFPIRSNKILPINESKNLTTENNDDKRKAYGYDLMGSEELGIQDIYNWRSLWSHIKHYKGMYDSFFDISEENGITSIIFSFSNHQYKFRNCIDEYLFGFDFYDMKMKYLEIDRILLGKTFFDKSILEHLKTDKSNFLECRFWESHITLSTVNNTRFYYCDFKSTHLGRFSIFDTIEFNNSSFTDSLLMESVFFKCNFTQCSIKNLFIGASIFIDSKFKNCDMKNITFNSAIMDENTLLSFFESNSFSRDDFDIEIVGYSDESQSYGNSAATTMAMLNIIWEVNNPGIFRNFLLEKAKDKKFYQITNKIKPHYQRQKRSLNVVIN